MKEIARFTIGSKYFFGKFEDYKSKDNDILILMDNWKLEKTNVLNLKDKKGNDVFFYKNMPKEDFIKDTLDSNVPMRCGKFLVREFNEYIGFDIEDLKKLEKMFSQMDEKHLYEKLIYKYYIENNKFELDEKQLSEVYKNYQKQ